MAKCRRHHDARGTRLAIEHTYIHTYISARVHTALDPADLPREEEGEEGAKGVEREAKDARGLHNLSGTSVGSLLCTLS